MQAPLPVPGGLGDNPITVSRRDHIVVYEPVAAGLRQAWRSPVIDARAGDYLRAGAEVAANVIALLQAGGLRQRADRSPYPRLRALLAALDPPRPPPTAPAGASPIRRPAPSAA
jgi:hypothetical protein